MATAVLTSVGGYLANLDENEEPEIITHSLSELNKHVDQFWHEIADSVQKMYAVASYME